MGAVKATQQAVSVGSKPATESSNSLSALKSRFEENKDDDAYAAAMAAVNAMESKKNGSTVETKVKFAGQAYTVERAKTQNDIKQEQRLAKNRLGGACGGLDEIMGVIGEKDKNVSCIDKSKLDWDKYTKDEKLESELEKNRKDGFLAKKRFIDNVSELEYQQKKQGQKESRKIQ